MAMRMAVPFLGIVYDDAHRSGALGIFHSTPLAPVSQGFDQSEQTEKRKEAKSNNRGLQG